MVMVVVDGCWNRKEEKDQNNYVESEQDFESTVFINTYPDSLALVATISCLMKTRW